LMASVNGRLGMLEWLGGPPWVRARAYTR
jgi:hypothetical protein